MREVPDHLIEKAAQAAFEVLSPDWTIATDFDRRFYLTTAHAALSVVADELRAEGARAERERIAREIEGITARRMDGGYLSPSAIAARVRERGDTDAQ